MNLIRRLPKPPKRASRCLDAHALRGVLQYADGRLFWLDRPRSMFVDERSFKNWHLRFSGQEAFTASHSEGYRVGRIFGRTYFAHRVIWAMHFGDIKSGQIDHINGDRADNRLSNLRLVSRSENMRNIKRPTTNKTGVVGVYPAGHKWRASIQRDGKAIHLGHFETFDQAAAARMLAEAELDFHPNHGRR